jgi:hypothetical protein
MTWPFIVPILALVLQNAVQFSQEAPLYVLKINAHDIIKVNRELQFNNRYNQMKMRNKLCISNDENDEQ